MKSTYIVVAAVVAVVWVASRQSKPAPTGAPADTRTDDAYPFSILGFAPPGAQATGYESLSAQPPDHY